MQLVKLLQVTDTQSKPIYVRLESIEWFTASDDPLYGNTTIGFVSGGQIHINETVLQLRKTLTDIEVIIPEELNSEWIPGSDGAVALRDDKLEPIQNAQLPPMNVNVQILRHDGTSLMAVRCTGPFHDTQWYWRSSVQVFRYDDRLIVAWRPVLPTE